MPAQHDIASAGMPAEGQNEFDAPVEDLDVLHTEQVIASCDNMGPSANAALDKLSEYPHGIDLHH